MSKRTSFFTLEGLVLIVAIYFGFAGASVILYLLTTGNFPIILAVSGVTVFFGYVLYIGYKHRQIAYFSAALSIVGMILIALTTMTYPQQTMIDLRVDKSVNMIEHMQATKEGYPNPAYETGLPREIILPPNSNVTYFSYWEAWGYYALNNTITEIRSTHNNTLQFSLVSIREDEWSIEYWHYNRTLFWSKGEDYPDYIYWTPPYSVDMLGFFFHNPGENDVRFSFSVMIYRLKNVEQISIAQNQPLAPPALVPAGLSLIGGAVFIEGYTVLRRRTKKTG